MENLRLIFEKQFAHLILLGILLFLLALASRLPGFWEGEFLGLTTRTWFFLSVVNTVVHQVYVWFCWRTQLHLSLMTKVFGGIAFKIYSVGFGIMIILRPVLITGLARSNENTLSFNPIVMQAAAIILLVPGIYLLYSIVRYFSFTRALGIDHFDESYRSLQLVREGIFRFTSNGMYIFGFLVLWAPAIFFSSIAAVAFAAFSHLYIWVHYYCTEKPDMEKIYS
jgi:protein-S-isoprenylcysteine O-methyltransferase Ste14